MSKNNKNSRLEKNHNPFKSLKGFAVSEQAPAAVPAEKKAVSTNQLATEDVNFTEQMAHLGVRPFGKVEKKNNNDETDVADSCAEEAAFLAAMQQLEVTFDDSFVAEQEKDLPIKHPPRRMKQLNSGTLVPQATLDLHGVTRQAVTEKMSIFIANARYHGWNVLLVITGKGLHSDQGEGVLRQAVEDYLRHQGRDQVVEWGRAPRQYGGAGAVVLFLQ